MKNEPLTITELQDVLDRALLPQSRSIVIPRDDVQQAADLLSDETLLKVWTIGLLSGVTSGLINLYQGETPPRSAFETVRRMAQQLAEGTWADPAAREVALGAIHATVDARHQPGCPCDAPWCSSRAGASHE